MSKRVFLIVMDSFGVGGAPDAKEFGDINVNTLRAVASSKELNCPNLTKMGLFNLDGIDFGTKTDAISGAAVRLQEISKGKDTTIGHWEISGVNSFSPLPTYPNGFPSEIIDEFEKQTGRKVLCNLPYSGTAVINDYGMEHMETGNLIVYTSADSVFQIAANEALVPVAQLYEYCEIARNILIGEHSVSRVIARPFVGTCPEDFTRTSNRHDYSIKPPKATMLDYLSKANKDVIGIGKINDIFDGQGLTEIQRTKNNADGIATTIELLDKDFDGLAFINLVDFDMMYGHRRDIDGYAKAVNEFDNALPTILSKMRSDDILMITADHGCDPAYTATTDHTRECVPLLIAGDKIKKDTNLGTVVGFGTIAKTICEYLDVDAPVDGESILSQIME